jgi:hypothetical protein
VTLSGRTVQIPIGDREPLPAAPLDGSGQVAGSHLRPTLITASPEELAELFDAFDVTAVYDKRSRTLELAATITPELLPEDDKPRRSDAPSGSPP